MISSSVRSYFSLFILRTCFKEFICRVGIRSQRLYNVDQVFVLRAAVEGFVAVVHRAVGDDADFGLALPDGYGKVLLQLACRDISDTRDRSMLNGFFIRFIEFPTCIDLYILANYITRCWLIQALLDNLEL